MDSEYFVELTDKSSFINGDTVATSGRRFPLSSVARGKNILILNIPQGRGRTQLIRLGIMSGEVIKCVERLPGGTVVVEKNRQEIAIGSSLAETILVDYTANDELAR